MTTEYSTFSHEIVQAMEAKSISIEKLSQLTGISERFLLGLLEEKYEQLPSQPYVRGYILRISDVLQLDGQRLWSEYVSRHADLRKSGKTDVLPQNRFRIKRVPRVLFLVFLIIVFVLGFFLFRFFSPAAVSGLVLTNIYEGVRVTSTPFIVIGSVNPNDRLMINEEEVYPDVGGAFEKEVALQAGYNVLVFKVKRFLGKEHVITKQVLYENLSAPLPEREIRGRNSNGSGGLIVPDVFSTSSLE